MNGDFIVCAAWGKQVVPSTLLRCESCGSDLAIANDNIEFARKKSLHPVCMPCVDTRLQPSERSEIRFAIGGNEYTRVRDAKIALDLLSRRN